MLSKRRKGCWVRGEKDAEWEEKRMLSERWDRWWQRREISGEDDEVSWWNADVTRRHFLAKRFFALPQFVATVFPRGRRRGRRRTGGGSASYEKSTPSQQTHFFWMRIRGSWGHAVAMTTRHLATYVACILTVKSMNSMDAFICVCIYTCMRACMYVCMHAYMYVCMYVCMYICMYVCMYLCMYICMYVGMYVCMHMYMLTSSWIESRYPRKSQFSILLHWWRL